MRVSVLMSAPRSSTDRVQRHEDTGRRRGVTQGERQAVGVGRTDSVGSAPSPFRHRPLPEVPMPVPPLPDDVAALLAQPNPAVMATLGSDGRPVSVATWYLLEEDGTILLNLDAARARMKHL